MLASALMAGVYFIVLPVVWLGVLGPEALGLNLATVLGPTFAPVLGTMRAATRAPAALNVGLRGKDAIPRSTP
jgi:hypothetical protein